MWLTKVLNYTILQLFRCFVEHCNEMDCTETLKLWFLKCRMQTLNRDSKVKGGLVGITLNCGAMHRWILGQAERAAIMRQCETMANVSTVISPGDT